MVRSSKDRIFCSFSPSALRMWESAACCRATDSKRSVMAWLRGMGAAVVVEVVLVVEVVVVVLVVVEVVVLLVVLVVVEVVVLLLVVLVVEVVLLVVVLVVEEVVLEVLVVVLVVLLVVVDVVEVVEVVLVVVLVVGTRQPRGSGSAPSNNSLWLSALPEKLSKMMLPLIWLKVVAAAAKGARTEP